MHLRGELEDQNKQKYTYVYVFIYILKSLKIPPFAFAL